MLHITLK
jgi:hypothetical protein